MLTSDWFDSDFQVKLENDVNILRLTPFYGREACLAHIPQNRDRIRDRKKHLAKLAKNAKKGRRLTTEITEDTEMEE